MLGHNIFKRSMFVLAVLGLAVAAPIALKIKLKKAKFKQTRTTKVQIKFETLHQYRVFLLLQPSEIASLSNSRSLHRTKLPN